MAKAYVVAEEGKTRPMVRVRCKNELKELQQILVQNPDLLPGDQITPDDPRRWLLIEEEMPVPDPASGGDRWSIDLLFVDQSAIPTFVECKRFEDTRARREVIGQMIEYAANGHHYWEEAELAERAIKNAENNGRDISDELQALAPDDDLSIGDFFERVQLNLREGQLRLVFFLEEAPMELKSIVDFLNRQMERSEVLLVEAQQFREGHLTVVYPRLFGYTEEARAVKKIRTVSSGPKRTWDEKSLEDQINQNLDSESANHMHEMLSFLTKLAPARTFGGGQNGSVNFRWPDLCNAGMFSLIGDGNLCVQFGAMHGNNAVIKARDDLHETLTSKFGLSVKADYEKRYPNFKVKEWGQQVEELKTLIEDTIAKALIDINESTAL
jgi:hypothetical protein